MFYVIHKFAYSFLLQNACKIQLYVNTCLLMEVFKLSQWLDSFELVHQKDFNSFTDPVFRSDCVTVWTSWCYLFKVRASQQIWVDRLHRKSCSVWRSQYDFFQWEYINRLIFWAHFRTHIVFILLAKRHVFLCEFVFRMTWKSVVCDPQSFILCPFFFPLQLFTNSVSNVYDV